MKFSAELIDSDYRITAWEPGAVRVGEVWHRQPLLLMPERFADPWAVADYESLTTADLAPLAGHGAEVILLGTGERHRFPDPALLRPLVEAGVGHEVMSTPAACRTYNILLAEGRRVLAALLV